MDTNRVPFLDKEIEKEKERNKGGILVRARKENGQIILAVRSRFANSRGKAAVVYAIGDAINPRILP